MALLADWVLKLDGESIGASPLEERDVTLSEVHGTIPCATPRVSFGVSATDVPRVRRAIGRVVRLVARDGQASAQVRIEKVDPELKIVVASLLEEEVPRTTTSSSGERSSGLKAADAGLPSSRGSAPELRVARSDSPS
jgi:hypothetical protein